MKSIWKRQVNRMSKNMITIMKKEFARLFGDKQLAFTTILLPGLMIFVLYSFMGKFMTQQFTTAEDYVYKIDAVNLPESLTALSQEERIDLNQVTGNDVTDIKQEIQEQEKDLLVVFPENFDVKVAAYDCTVAGEPAPNVELYYNSVSTESTSAYNMVAEVLDQYEAALSNKFDINAGTDIVYDMATDQDTSAQIFSMMLPMLLMIFLFSGCMAIAPESIAGEKERGTIATLLVTPMKRSELAVGKILSLSIIGLLSGVSSFIGTMLSMPNLMGAAAEEGGLSADVYSPMDFILLLLVILSTVLVIIGLISLISAASKSVKEAGTAVSPLMIIVMVISVTSMMGGGAPEQAYLYAIPFYNSVQCMNGIFSFSIMPVNFVITILCNVIYTILMVGILAKMFDSEKMMYNV